MMVRFRNHVRVESKNSWIHRRVTRKSILFFSFSSSPSFTPSKPWKISRIIIFVTLDVCPPHRDGQSRIATTATIIRQLSTARRSWVGDYDKSMIAVGEFITRLARMRFRSRGRSRKASSSTGCEHRKGRLTEEGGRVGLLANPARCMVIKISGKNIANGRRLYGSHMRDSHLFFFDVRSCSVTKWPSHVVASRRHGGL